MLWKHPMSLYSLQLYYRVGFWWDIPLKYPLKHFLTSWPWPLTYDLDLQTWPRYPSTWPTYRNSSLYVCPFGRESGNRYTHRQTHDVKIIRPDTSQTRGVITLADLPDLCPLKFSQKLWVSLYVRDVGVPYSWFSAGLASHILLLKPCWGLYMISS